MARTPDTDWTIPALRHRIKELEDIQGNLVALVNRLVYQIRQSDLPRDVTDKALEYLCRKGMQGSPLIRAESESDE